MNRNLPDAIEHTVLGPETTRADVEAILDAADELGMRACIPPCYLEWASEYRSGIDLSTVVGFPHGQHAVATVVEEARVAWQDGADELDLVANVGLLRAGETERYRDAIAEVTAAVPRPVKVIIEAPLLTDEEKHRACQLVVDAGADMLKTATGFSEGGATVEDVALMSDYLPVKASGGIRTWSDARELFQAGADRIGASSGDDIVEGYRRRPDGPGDE